MYLPPHFTIAEDAAPAVLSELLAGTAATLVTTGTAGLTSTILPLLFDPAAGPLGTLTGHVARGNPIVREGHAGEALVVVTGAAGYISPSWYPSKVEHGRVVPTWDYITVEAAGELRIHDDVEWLRALVTDLTDRHEAGTERPWAVTDAPADYLTSALRGIVGIEVPLTRLTAKAKLSQNRPRADIAGVITGLRGEGGAAAQALADAIEAAR
ncbi:MAG: transcriptional regulator [Acidimicrobiales bacterium]|nr:transcriptional regulator [Acidimicrobiales bacterium]